MHIDTISMEQSILYLKPLTVLKLMYLCTFLNRTDTDEMPLFVKVPVASPNVKLEHIRWRAIANPHALEEI